MSEIQKRIITEEVKAPIVPGPVQPKPQEIEAKTGNEATPTEKRLDLWELNKGHKYAEEYFGFRELIAGDFKLKMDVSKIDKYLKEEMAEKGYDFTIETYQQILGQMEATLNSKILNPRLRLQKINNWINALKKISQAEKLKTSLLG